MSSTATSIGSLVQSGVWKTNIPPDDTPGWWMGAEAELFRRLLQSKWTSADLEVNNAFTLGFVVEACHHLKLIGNLAAVETEEVVFSNKDYQTNGKKDLGIPNKTNSTLFCWKRRRNDCEASCLVERMIPIVFPLGSVSVLEYPPSAYLTQLAGRALAAVGKLNEADGNQIASWAAKEIGTQIALIEAGSRSSDPMQLAYAVICVASFRPVNKETPSELELIRDGLGVPLPTT